MQIIDARVRYDFNAINRYSSIDGLGSQYSNILPLQKNRVDNLEDLVKILNEESISKAILHAEYEEGNYADYLNQEIVNAVREYPELFIGVGTITMDRIDIHHNLEQIEYILENNLKGINIQPSFFEISMNSNVLYPTYALAEKYNLILAVHTGINYSSKHLLKYEQIMYLDQIARDFPELKIIANHSGWPWVNELVALMQRHKNIYIDFGGISPKYIGMQGSGWEMMYHFMNNILQDKILFSTDWPAYSHKKAVEEWRNINLKESVLKKLFYKNVKKLYQI